MEILKKGTLNCPCCKEPMAFNCFGPIRIKEEIKRLGKGLFYKALCQKTKKHYFVIAPIDK